jgi:GNAT superfamily N-acetyltransferase
LVWHCDFERDSERNFAMIVSRQAQGLGIGTKLLSLAKSINNSLFGWVVIGDGYKKIDGSEYPSPVGFYEKTGFDILYDQTWESDVLKTVKIRWGKEL